MKRHVKTMRMILCALPLWLGADLLVEAQQPPFPHVILADGRRMDGTSIRARANGDIILVADRGELTFTRQQYREAWAARPAELDQARQLLQANRHDQVISTLEGVVTSMRNLGWDIDAMAMIGAAQVGKGDHAAALSTFDRLFQAAPQRREEAAIRWSYLSALLGAGQLDRLESTLNELIASGPRPDAARAQVMRGDLKSQRGLNEEAALDYLRTIVLFRAATDVQAEATYKAALALEAMRHDKARDLFRSVVEQYGNSPYAAQARAKM